MPRVTDRLIFSCATAAGRDAVIAVLGRLAVEQAQRPPSFWSMAPWQEWHRHGELRPRPLASIALADGLLEEIVGDLALFLGDEAQYLRLGVPWHRGYLFHGPPGCGKTSTARALAGALHLPLRYLSLSAVKSDQALGSLFMECDERSMLVIEDIDVAHGARHRDDSEPGVSLAGLLNCLDGFYSPHGVVVVMTTNDPAVLDDALVRPGRADRVFEFGPLDASQFCRLVEALTGIAVTVTGSAVLTPAQVVGVIKDQLGDPIGAASAAVALWATATRASTGPRQ